MKTYNNPPKNKWSSLCQRPNLSCKNLESKIENIFKDVQNQGDKALLSYTKKFDGIELESARLTQYQRAKLSKKTPKKLQYAINEAYKNIYKFHRDQNRRSTKKTETVPGATCWSEIRPIEKVGLYIPGGTAPLISTVLMLGIPAQIAGCNEIILCTPSNKNGQIDPGICYAADKVGATKIIRIGGAQAIAGLTYGTETIPKVDKIFGPGNHYVTAAKQYSLTQGTAIDLPAGPSEVLVIADYSSEPSYVAADLLSQAEHGVDSQVVLVSVDKPLAKRVMAEVKNQLKLLPRKKIAEKALKNSFCVIFDDVYQAVDFTNIYASEHVIINMRKANVVAKKIKNAGSVFIGPYSPESAGDYASGTNHTLPTNGWARSYSGVLVSSFTKELSFQKLSRTGLSKLAPTIEALAEAEGLKAHANAVTIRLGNKVK